MFIAEGVMDALSGDAQVFGSPLSQKLFQVMLVNLPKHEDEAILKYGKILLDHPEHLTPLEILEVAESVEKALLTRQDYDTAFHLMERMEKYAVDERTKAEFCGLMSNIYDYREAPGDHEEMFRWLESGIMYARQAPSPERKHLLAEFLLGKLNVFTRSRIRDEAGIDGLIREVMEIIEKECLPNSEICCGFAYAMGFYWAELGRDQNETEGWIAAARKIGKKLYPAGLDFIDNCIIPPAIMYIDLGNYEKSESALREGIQICEDHSDLIAYVRKKHDLHRYMLDVYLEAQKYQEARETLIWLDNNAHLYGFADTIQSEVRDFLENLKP